MILDFEHGPAYSIGKHVKKRYNNNIIIEVYNDIYMHIVFMEITDIGAKSPTNFENFWNSNFCAPHRVHLNPYKLTPLL